MSHSFEVLLPEVLDTAYRVALHLTRNPTDAEDLVQEASLHALAGFSGFEPGTNFKAWFLRILSNDFYSACRKRRRSGIAVSLDSDEAPLFLYRQTKALGWHEEDEDPATRLMDRFESEEVSRAIQALPLEYRTVSTLYFLADASYQQISEMLGCPVGTVRSRLHRGRRLLQQALWAIAEERGITRGAKRRHAATGSRRGATQESLV